MRRDILTGFCFVYGNHTKRYFDVKWTRDESKAAVLTPRMCLESKTLCWKTMDIMARWDYYGALAGRVTHSHGLKKKKEKEE